MTTAPEAERGPGVAQVSPWVQRVVAEMVRGRHVIVHGNVHDLAVWQHQFVPVPQILRGVLRELGFQLIGRYDQLDGVTVEHAADGRDADREFAQLLENAPGARPAAPGRAGRGPAADGPGATASAPGAADGGNSGAGAAGRRGSRAAEARTAMATASAVGAARPVRYSQPGEALAVIRRALAQPQTPIAFLLDFADLLLTDPEHNDRNDRNLLLLVKKAMMEAVRAPGGVVENQLVLVTTDLAAIPAWLYRGEPFVQPVLVPLPGADEREAYLSEQAGLYYQSQTGQAHTGPVRVLANLTEGMALRELAGLSRTSHLEHLPLASARELVNRAMFGQPVDPWARLAERLPTARAVLGESVRGQDAAVERVTRALAGGTLGMDFIADPFSAEAQPKGVFFFAGPTGVGKTELCKTLSRLIFDDPSAMIRFDMSTFQESHAAERLTGAPPGYVGHERGGELTNQVSARPFSLLLFDEIEKAHNSIFDKFLQILEDGRFTDGLGRVTYFSQTLIVFTSNAGADTLYDRIRRSGPGRPLPSPKEVAEHFEKAVQDYFTKTLRRPELLGRMGNGVLAFDIVRPQHVDPVAAKLLGQLAASAQRRGITLELDRESIFEVVRQHMAVPDNLALGYREIRNALGRLVRDPLIDAIWLGGRQPGYAIGVAPGEKIATVRPCRPGAQTAGAA